MADQPRYEPLEDSEFFPDRQSARPYIPHTVPRGEIVGDEEVFESYLDNIEFETGRTESGELVENIPIHVTLEVLERGQENYNSFCSPCHGLSGYGEGIVVQRGFPNPPSFHQDTLRLVPVGYIYYVISNGYGEMYEFDNQIRPKDRWAIVAYFRALQLSQNAEEQNLQPEDLQQLQAIESFISDHTGN